MEDRFTTREVLTSDGELKTLACTGKKDNEGTLVFEGDTIKFQLPNDSKVLEGDVVYREDLLTYFVENKEVEEELWAVEILKVIE